MFAADGGRYKRMLYRRMGTTGVKLSVITLGLGYNFETMNDYINCKKIVLTAFNNGINSFDLSSTFGKPVGLTEEVFGKILKEDLMPYRDEIIISTKVGGDIGEHPMGEGGSRKQIISSLDKTLARLGVPYVDIVYHENFDFETNPEETAFALADCVKAGKALYVGLTNYSSLEVRRMAEIFKKLNVPFVGGQVKYSLLSREIEEDNVIETLADYGAGCMCYHSLEHGLLTNKYISGDNDELPRVLPTDQTKAIDENGITDETRGLLTKFNISAALRNQSISQLALAWAIRNPKMASVVVGVSKIPQLGEDIAVIKKLGFTLEELKKLDGNTKKK